MITFSCDKCGEVIPQGDFRKVLFTFGEVRVRVGQLNMSELGEEIDVSEEPKPGQYQAVRLCLRCIRETVANGTTILEG